MGFVGASQEGGIVRTQRRSFGTSAAVLFAAALMVVSVIGGSYGLVSSAEPPTVSYSLGTRPWLLPLGPERFGVVFENHGFVDGVVTSGILYGVVTAHGEWVSGPSLVTRPDSPAEPGTYGPAGVTARIDEGKRVHIAWALWNSIGHALSFHYLQLDPTGSVRAKAGPLAILVLPGIGSPILLGLRISSDEVQIAFPGEETYMVATLNQAGVVTSQPYPVPSLDNATFFPPRSFPPGVSLENQDSMDSDASAVADGTITYYLWINGRQWFEGLLRRTYRSEEDLQFLRSGSSLEVSRVLYSTEDTWWLSKPFVLPSFFSILTGASVFSIVAWAHHRPRKSKGL